MRDALASFRARSIRGKSFRAPLAPELLSLCVAKEKVTKEKGHPACALSGHRATAPALPPLGHPCPRHARKVRGRATGFFDSTSGNRSLRCLHSGIHAVACAGEKLAGILAGHPAGFPSPVRRCRGAPGRAARSQRALFRGARSRAGAKPRRSAALPWLWLFSSITECGPGWPAALPGVPCAAVRRGRQAAQRALPGMATPFRTGRMPVRKNRPRLTNLPGMARAWMPEWRQRRSSCPMPGKRQAGWPFSWVTFSLLRASCPTPFGPASLFAHASCVRVATQRESDSVAAGDRPLFALNAKRASRTGCAPTGTGGRRRFALMEQRGASAALQLETCTPSRQRPC